MGTVFSELVKTIAGISVITMIVEYLTPNGTFQHSIRIVTGLVFLIAILHPIRNLMGITW